MELHIEELKEYNNLFDIDERKELIGQVLKELRLASKKKQSEIAELLGIKAGTYSTYENGTREMPAELIVRTSILYGLPADFLLQTEARTREIYDTKKQIDAFNDQMDELKDLISANENELNPDVKEFLNSMTKAFDMFGEQFEKQFNNDK